MILAALQDYYRRLENDPKSDVVPAGYSRQKIAFRINLKADGALVGIEPLGEVKGKRRTPEAMIVLGQSKPSGSGVNPCLLWDNPQYMLGYKPDDPKPVRTAETFAAFRDKHLELEAEIDDPGFSAVCRFLKNWNPDGAADRHPELADAATGFGVFHLANETGHVHDRPAVQAWWEKQLKTEAAAVVESGAGGQCLLTGGRGPIARLHEPKIKGVNGAQSSGALLVSFNFNATESYGRSQGENAPVGEAAAFQYAVALNRLLDRDGGRRVQVGDATVVFWTERPSPAENFLGLALDPPTEDDETAGQVAAALAALKSGECPPEWGDPATPFYMLGLSPNAARLSVRFWKQGTLGELVRNAHRHFEEMSLGSEPKPVPLWLILKHLGRQTPTGKWDDDAVSPMLAGPLLGAILNGTPYPRTLLNAVLGRVRADRLLTPVRVGAMKAFLNREERLKRTERPTLGGGPLPAAQPFAPDPENDPTADRPEPAYHLGRLLAELDRIKYHADSSPDAERVVAAHAATAAATPAAVFPRLIAASRHHLAKIQLNARRKPRPSPAPAGDAKETYGERATRRAFGRLAVAEWAVPRHERTLAAIAARLESFPPHLTADEQALFYVGCYHELWRPREAPAADALDSPTSSPTEASPA